MAWCHQSLSQSLIPCWLKSMVVYCITWPQCFKATQFIFLILWISLYPLLVFFSGTYPVVISTEKSMITMTSKWFVKYIFPLLWTLPFPSKGMSVYTFRKYITFHTSLFFNSLWLSDVASWSTLAQVMACCLSGTKALPETILINWEYNT